jgi:hypothetical protein
VPALMMLCAGYELGEWRQTQFVDEIFAWLPSFVLPWTEQQEALGSPVSVDLLRQAVQRVYETDKYSKRGEFGELILHGVLCQEYGTTAAISTFWFKDAANSTVKGFDVVHISGDDEPGSSLELWIGEAKFYADVSSAIASAITSVQSHLDANYLKSKFMLVSSKVDKDAPYAAELLDLLDKNTSLDEVFSVLHIPVLVTYNSAAVNAFDKHCDEYFDAVRAEVVDAWEGFAAAFPATAATIDVIFVPLLDKATFVGELHERLKTWQAI